MPLDLDSQQSEVIKPAETVDYDSVKIKSHMVDSDEMFIIVFYRKLLAGVVVADDDGDEILFQHKITGQKFGAVVMAPPDGATRSADIKAVLYAQLITDLGLIGTVS